MDGDDRRVAVCHEPRSRTDTQAGDGVSGHAFTPQNRLEVPDDTSASSLSESDEDQDREGESAVSRRGTTASCTSPELNDFPLQTGARVCDYYDLVPVVAAPQATHAHCVAVTRGLRWLLTAGQDGYIRKYDFALTISGKVPLTVAQKHPFVDSVQRSGVLTSYWDASEEEETQAVYSLAVHPEGLWSLSGLANGRINLHSVRVDEGRVVATLEGHTGPVSVLMLLEDERTCLSGGWDKHLNEWDLNTGQSRRNFLIGHDVTGQVAALAMRPGGPVIRAESQASDQVADTSEATESNQVNAALSPRSNDSFDPLFDEEDLVLPAASANPDSREGYAAPTDTLLCASIDGMISLWDRRQARCLTRISPSRGSPPWCMSACWSVDGEAFYVGRRNATVEGYDVRNFQKPFKQLKMPNNSGPVTLVKMLPNRRSLIAASHDNVRLYDLEAKSTTLPFLIVPGHHGGTVSDFYIDPVCRYAISASGNRGWDGTSTEAVLVYEIEPCFTTRAK
ncbi:Transcription factor spt8 [Savitreella phatthalungensis]